MKLLHTHLVHFSLPVLVVCVVAVILRLPLLGGSFWLDEAAQSLESIRPLNQQLNIAQDFQPPLLHLITHFAIQFSTHEWWLRTIGALIPGIISVYYSYKIGEKLFSQKVACVAALLLATSSFHIFYSQELRPYSLAVLWAMISWYLIVRRTFAEKKQMGFSWQESILLGVVTAAGLYSTYLYPFVIISQLCFVIWDRRAFLKSFSISAVITAILFAPWVPYLLEQLRVGQLLRIQLPGWESVVAIPQLKSLPITFGKFIFGVLNIEINAVFILLTAVVLSATAMLFWQKRKEGTISSQLKLLFCWTVIPLITAWLVSFWVPILQPKRVLFILPGLFLLFSAISLEFTKKQRNYSQLGYGLIGILFALNIFSTVSYYTNPEYQRENWRDLHHTILEKYPHSTAVIFGFTGIFAPWQWYDDGTYPVITAGDFSDTPTTILDQLKPATQYPYLLVFDYLRDLTDPGHTIESELQNLGYTQKDIFAVPQIGFIRVYARQDAVLSERSTYYD